MASRPTRPGDLLAALAAPMREHLGETFPACAISVRYQKAAVLDAAWGWVDPVRRQHAVTTHTLFDLASVSKLYTATAYLALVSAGKTALDDPLVRVIPEFGRVRPRPIDGGQDPHSKQRLPTPPELTGRTADPAAVTFRHLLTHTSGLPPWRDVFTAAGDVPAAPDQPEPTPRAVRWTRALNALCGYPFVGLPGERVRYSDIGLLLLGEAVTRLADAPDLAAALHTLIPELPVYNPIRDHGIPREQIAPTEADPTWRKRRAWGEVHDENACGVGGIAGHAGLFASARTIAAFGQRWLDGAGALGIDPALAAAAITEQIETDGARRGLGFALRARHDASAGERLSLNTYGHTGFTGTSLWIDPDHALVIACLTNSVYPGREKTGTHEFRRAVHDAIAAVLL